MKPSSILALCFGLLGGTLAFAGSLGPNCGSCFGGIYTLDATLQSSTATTETFLVTYGLDLTGVNESNVQYVSSIAAKVVAGPNLISASNASSPTGGNWSLVPGNLNSNGCEGGGSGWLCLQYISGAQMLTGAAGSPYEWQFLVTVKTGTLTTSGASIQANFDPAVGKLMSEKINVPEGSATELPILLSGIGLVLLWRKRRVFAA